MTKTHPCQWFSLSPTDAWFFRDGRQSNRDEDQSDLQSLFPPHAQTVVGAIRAALAREMGWNGRSDWSAEIKSALGDGFDNLGRLSFTGPFLQYDNQLLFPLPKHVCGRHGVNTGRHTFEPLDWLHPSNNPIRCDIEPQTGVHLPQLMQIYQTLPGDKPLAHSDEFFITRSGLEKVLQGNLPAIGDCKHRDELYALEARIGIQRNEAGVDNSLYSPQYIRLQKNVSLVIGLTETATDTHHGNPGLPTVFPLGGESRMANCDPIPAPKMPQTPPDGECLYLATAASFNSNWYGAGPAANASLLHPDLTGTIKTAMLDRPFRIGGFDSRSSSKGPLPLKPFAAPGTLWWLNNPQHIHTSELRLGQHTSYGYGLAFLGKVPA